MDFRAAPRIRPLVLLFGLLLHLCGCAPSKDPGGVQDHAIPLSHTAQFRGAGATFPHAVYARWTYEYFQETRVNMNYEPIGSVRGIEEARAGRVDFGGSDIPLSAEELERDGLVQFPLIIGGVVPVVHLPGVGPGDLKLSGDTLGTIFTGGIRRWDHPGIRLLNPDMELPDEEIVVVYRVDASGTTWNFSNYLRQASPDWAIGSKPGDATMFPVGVGAEGNAQVARFVKQFKYTISYVEFAYAVENDLSWVMVRNIDGEYVAPSVAGFREAAERGRWLGARQIILTNLPGESWPITSASYVLMKKEQKNASRARSLLEFFHWAYTEGGGLAAQLRFVSIPAAHISAIEDVWAQQITAGGEPVWNQRGDGPPEVVIPSSEPVAPAGGQDGAAVR